MMYALLNSALSVPTYQMMSGNKYSHKYFIQVPFSYQSKNLKIFSRKKKKVELSLNSLQ